MKTKYCGYCGQKLVKVIVPAEKVTKWLIFNSYHPFNQFDLNKGHRQYAWYWKCPRYSRWPWGFNHDEYEQDAKLAT